MDAYLRPIDAPTMAGHISPLQVWRIQHTAKASKAFAGLIIKEELLPPPPPSFSSRPFVIANRISTRERLAPYSGPRDNASSAYNGYHPLLLVMPKYPIQRTGSTRLFSIKTIYPMQCTHLQLFGIHLSRHSSASALVFFFHLRCGPPFLLFVSYHHATKLYPLPFLIFFPFFSKGRMHRKVCNALGTLDIFFCCFAVLLVQMRHYLLYFRTCM